MRIFATILFVVFFNIARSQQFSGNTITQLTATMNFLQQGEYQKAIDLATSIAPVVKTEGGELNPIYNGLFFIMGFCNEKLYHFSQAETNYLTQKDLIARSMGQNNKDYAACLARLAILYRQMGKYNEAIALLKQVQITTRTVLGENDPNYSTCLNNLALLHADIGEYTVAEKIYLESMSIFKKTVGEESEPYANALNNLGTLYSDMGLDEKAIISLQRVREIRKKVVGPSSASYAEALNNIAGVYCHLGRYTDAESLYIEASSILKKTAGAESPSFATALNNLAYYYQQTGNYDKAEQMYLEAATIRKKILGPEHPDYGTSLANLAGLYVISGDYAKAESNYLRAKEIALKSTGEDHPEYASCLNNLASLYEAMGQYRKAEPLYQQSLSIRKKLLGESHPSYALALNNLAYLYYNIGQYEKTEPLFLKASQTTKAALGEYNLTYATCLNNLANVWQSLEQYTKAEEAYLKVIDIYKKIVGTSHNDYALALNNLAGLYADQDLLQKAEPLLIEAASTWKQSTGATSPAYATGLNNLGALYRKMQNQPGKSETYYLQALELRKQVLGERHPYFADTQNDLGLLYMQSQQFSKAEPLFLNSSKTLLQNISGTFTILSEKEKSKFLSYNRKMVECNNSFLYIYPNAPGSIAENNYNLELSIKSLSLVDTRNMLNSIRETRDTTTHRLLNEWLASKTLLSKNATSSANNIAKNESIERRTEELEKELNRRSTVFREQTQSARISYADVKNSLASDEAAIEFIRFKLYRQGWTDSTIYAAFIIRKDQPSPIFIPLCEKKQLQSLFENAGTTATRMVKSFYRGLGTSTDEAKLGKQLYDLIWKPLEPFLKDVKKVLYSPTGKLYSVAFHALPIDSNLLLLDKYQLQQFTSTRDIALRNHTRPDAKPKGIVLFGNPRFSIDSIDLVKLRNNKNYQLLASRSNSNGPWLDLPGTLKEVNNIATTFRTNKIPAELFTDAQASEDNFKKLSGSTSPILHIATHGFFLPDQKKKKAITETTRNAYSQSEDPLLRTGLVFSGGNYAWTGHSPVDGIEDGIATAFEIAQMNLNHTELVVLSACETALGDVKGTEGVFGLQRGFKMAGVKKMIVSLWQVPDETTAELMKLFYLNWLKGMSMQEAFRDAQTTLRKKYPPYYWAAFVLVE